MISERGMKIIDWHSRMSVHASHTPYERDGGYIEPISGLPWSVLCTGKDNHDPLCPICIARTTFKRDLDSMTVTQARTMSDKDSI